MKTFITDLWADLRAKRLWPVAVLLLAGLVAVPVVLKKSAEEPPPADPVAAGPRNAPEPKELKGLASVTLEETDVEGGSSLDTFDPSDPFRPPQKVVDEAEEEASGGESGSSDGVVTGGATTSGGDTGGGDTGSGDTGSGGTGGGGDTGDGGTSKTTQYTYVIDVTFTNNGRTRRIKGMQRLDMLPSAASPLLLFLGVSEKGGNAVFLVDSTLDSAGEGNCKPSRSECAFLYLGAGSEHEFTNEDGDSYTLEIDQIRKVKVGSAGAASASRRGAKADAAVGSPTASRRFMPPLIADLVSVSSSAAGVSDSNQDRR
jgi:hypothetical protein